jgi:hypothetical protein
VLDEGDTNEAEDPADVVTLSGVVVAEADVVTGFEPGLTDRGGVENTEPPVVGATDVGPVAVGLDDKTDVGRTVTPPTSGNEVLGIELGVAPFDPSVVRGTPAFGAVT